MRTGTSAPQVTGWNQVGLAVLHRDPRLSIAVTVASGFPSRHSKNNEKAQEASVLLRDNLELQNFLQNCQEVRLQQGRPLRRRLLSQSRGPQTQEVRQILPN